MKLAQTKEAHLLSPAPLLKQGPPKGVGARSANRFLIKLYYD